MRLSGFILIAIFIGSCKAQPRTINLRTNKDNNTLLWEISGNGLAEPSYLFGSFHLLCKSDIHFSEQLLAAVHQSAEVYLELDLDDPSTLVGGLLLMNMNGGKKLSDLYSADEYKKVDLFFKDSLNTSLVLFHGMKPAFLESMLYPKLLPCKSISGVEEELMQVARKEKKEINGLETIAFQASVFDSIPYAEQAKELLKTIDSLTAYKQFFDTLVSVYKSQNLNDIEKMFSKSEFGMEENQDLLLNNRNKNWVMQLKTIFQKKSIFIAVGAGHLVGEKGLIALLRKDGYTVRPLVNK